jgi:hypothetical protein
LDHSDLDPVLVKDHTQITFFLLLSLHTGEILVVVVLIPFVFNSSPFQAEATTTIHFLFALFRAEL